MIGIAALSFALVATTAEPVASDAALPAGVAEMIDAALSSGDQAEVEAVLRAARRAYPAAGEAIDHRVAAWKATRLVSTPTPAAAVPVKATTSASEPPALVRAVKWTGEGEAGAFANTGNAPGIGLVGGFKLLVEGENWRVGTTARADYQETDSVVTREQYRFSAEPNYKFDDRGYLYGLGQYEKDRFQGFASRYSISGGLGYSVLKDEGAKLSVKAGPAWRVTNAVGGERESVVAGLASLEAKVKLGPGLEYSQDASAYVDAQGSTFYTLAALDSRLIGKLKARLSYMVQHETAPELGRLGTDTTSRLTLVYGF
ncbi:DUF481 domain-containing protein [Novosphingobium taihuense]|uniref:Putative salt-induced outer membrane protein n=1 Tax=Novosphingobium taihuense TaxID=260085 RepID=A0A7W7AB11_9SPHN|nr:DUF481 domain-containing protein [Novosphingobium taihuense]MBB4613616.1 putative salt-induced outer membrane protein [Novosphingobium taihuense]